MKTAERTQDFGQIKFNVLGMPIEIPIKVRVQSRFLPDFTIDPTKPSKTGSPLSILKPKITVLVGNKAYQVDTEGNFKEVPADIFNKPTLLDRISEYGILPTATFALGLGLLTFALIRRVWWAIGL